MAETREGGVYKVGDEWQNAMGEKVSAPTATEEAANDAGGQQGGGSGSALDGVDFASEAAREAAQDANLTADDFKGASPSSGNGFTKPDVQAIAEAKG